MYSIQVVSHRIVRITFSSLHPSIQPEIQKQEQLRVGTCADWP